MPAFWRDASLSAKLSLLGVVSVVATAAVLVALAVWQSGAYHDIARREVDRLVDADLDSITQGVYNLVRTEDEAVQQQVNDNLNVAYHVLAGMGELATSAERLRWSATDQLTGETIQVSLPRMYVGGAWLGWNADPAVPTPVVDEVVRLVGGTCTIFVRLNPAGDMLRVATTVADASGGRAIGSYIPASAPDGTPNPVISTVRGGKTYHGRASVVGAWYLTAYGPLPMGSADPIGMLYVGVKMDDVEARVRGAILQTRVGDTGYVYVLGGSGEWRGRYIISQRGERDGEDIWGSVDSDGRFIIQEIAGAAVALGPGEMTTIRYRWQNPGEAAPRWKSARLAYYAPWDWVIGTSVYDDELQAYRGVLTSGRARMSAVMGIAGLAITVLVGFLSTLLALTIARPIQQMTVVTERIAGGDLEQGLEVKRRDEVGILAGAFNRMANRLKETMAVLRTSEAKYREIVENAVEGLFQSTFEGRFLSANPAMARILGYESPEELTRSITSIGTQLYARPEEREETFVRLREQGSAPQRDVQVRRKDGEIIWVSLGVRLVRDASGAPLHIEGFLMDIRERKREEEHRLRLEEQLRQAQKMETVGLLAGGVAHDFNNLLTPIQGYSEMLIATLPAGDPRADQLEQIRQAAERAGELTRRLLAFSRKQLIELRTVDLGEVIRRFEVVLRRTIRENVRIGVEVASPLDQVRADVGQIEQILLNLSINARDAMPEGGALTVRAENVDLTGSVSSRPPDLPSGRYVMLSVRDTGVGMDGSIVAHLFEPFFTTKRPGEGTGLGLATVYGIVKQHGGSIAVESAKGQGSTFSIYFPRVAGGEAAPEAEAARQGIARGSETILVAEDNEMVRSLACSLLRNLGYNVLTAETVDQCRAVSGGHPERIHLLVTDVVMPGMNGRELYQLLRQGRPDLKVLYMSGYTREVIGSRGVVDEGMHFIQKPFTLRSLSGKVREALAG